MPNDSDRLTALETEHRNLKDAIAKEFINERKETTFTIDAVVVRIAAVEGEMSALTNMHEEISTNLQLLVTAERDRTTRETLAEKQKEQSEKEKEKSFMAKLRDKLAEHLAMLLAAALVGGIMYLLAAPKLPTIGG